MLLEFILELTIGESTGDSLVERESNGENIPPCFVCRHWMRPNWGYCAAFDERPYDTTELLQNRQPKSRLTMRAAQVRQR